MLASLTRSLQLKYTNQACAILSKHRIDIKSKSMKRDWLSSLSSKEKSELNIPGGLTIKTSERCNTSKGKSASTLSEGETDKLSRKNKSELCRSAKTLQSGDEVLFYLAVSPAAESLSILQISGLLCTNGILISVKQPSLPRLYFLSTPQDTSISPIGAQCYSRYRCIPICFESERLSRHHTTPTIGISGDIKFGRDFPLNTAALPFVSYWIWNLQSSRDQKREGFCLLEMGLKLANIILCKFMCFLILKSEATWHCMWVCLVNQYKVKQAIF